MTSIKQGIARYPLRFFLAAVGLLGICGIWGVYALHLNYPPIRSDGLGYYLYLPATFIYHDLSLQSIADVFMKGAPTGVPNPSLWVNDGPSLWKNSSVYLIKYPLGTAILMLPFFLFACLLALATSAPYDGFSPVFQYLTAFSGLFYALAGIAVLWKVLARHFRQETIGIAMLGLVFGTDFFHYATYDSVFSHVFSFFLFSAFLWTVQRVYVEARGNYFALAGFLAGLIIVTRPTNGLWLLFGLFYGVDSRASLSDRFSFWKSHALEMLYAATLCALVLSLQLCYWKATTGQFVVFSYQGEQFNFSRPQIVNVLFSVRKGLFFWSPVWLLAIPGLLCLRKRAREYVVPIVLFLPLNIYLISSWHSWFYGGCFGHRAFVESTPIFAVCFCALYETLTASILRRALICLIVLSAVLESWLMLKYWTGVIPFDGTTWDYFIHTFFILNPR
jgi:hypothetical protein